MILVTNIRLCLTGNIIKVNPQRDEQSKFRYCIDRKGKKQFVQNLIPCFLSCNLCINWTASEVLSFVNYAVRGFLYSDLYTGNVFDNPSCSFIDLLTSGYYFLCAYF